MQKRLVSAWMLGMAMGLVTPAIAADNPRVIFERCSERIARMAERCVQHNIETKRECVPIIIELLRNNRYQEARHLAELCIERINQTSRRCVEQVTQDCRRCVAKLLELNAHQLAHELERRCERAVSAIEDSRRRCVREILDLF